MSYTQMLFALTFDKLVFNHTPGLLSIAGSSLILGSAIVVALQKQSEPVQIKPVSTHANTGSLDVESQTDATGGFVDFDRASYPREHSVGSVQLQTMR